MIKFVISMLYFPLILPSIIAYLLASDKVKRKVLEDIAFQGKRRGYRENANIVYRLYHLLLSAKEFRNVYYCRFGRLGKLLNLFLHQEPTLFINPVLCKNYEGGLYIAHGTSTQIYANKIGRNLWMHHNVTIGMIGEGRPEIGDNVYIGTGAVILGGIKIGNNVRIGANAIVIDNVPDNSVVVSPKARVVKIYDNDELARCNAMTDAVGGGQLIAYQIIIPNTQCGIANIIGYALIITENIKINL